MNDGQVRCQSQSSAEWKQVCDCAMLGALHRVLKHNECLHFWHTRTAQEMAEGARPSLWAVVRIVESARLATISESKMNRRQGGAHVNCTPWARFSLNDILAAHKLEDLIPVDEEYFKQQAEKSGLKDDSTTNGLFGGKLVV